MKTTTLREILKHKPCKDDLEKLLNALKYPTRKKLLTKEQLNAELPTRSILAINGIKDTLWALRIFAGTPDWYRFKADIAESVLHIFEKEYPLDKRPRIAIQVARDFANGKISKEELEDTIDYDYYTEADAFTAAYANSYDDYAAAKAAYLAWVHINPPEGDVEAWEEITKILLKYI